MRCILDGGSIQFACGLSEGENSEPKRTQGVLFTRQALDMLFEFGHYVGIAHLQRYQKFGRFKGFRTIHETLLMFWSTLSKLRCLVPSWHPCSRHLLSAKIQQQNSWMCHHSAFAPDC